MFGCPRCGNDAVYLADEVFSLLRCEFCGDDLDAEVLLQDIDHIGRGLVPGSGEELLPPPGSSLRLTHVPGDQQLPGAWMGLRQVRSGR